MTFIYVLIVMCTGFLDVRTTWCTACKFIDNNPKISFTSAYFLDLKNFVVLKIKKSLIEFL